MRINLNLSEVVVKAVETLYFSVNRSKAVEKALEEAIHHIKWQSSLNSKGIIAINVEPVKK